MSLFPIHSSAGDPGEPMVIEPYREHGTWVFDDDRVGLVKEPFVAGINEMIDRLVASIPGAEAGVRLQFSASPFDGWQTSLTWVRADPVEGHWYRADDVGDEGWLCPAMFWYFRSAPPKIYLAASAKA